MKHMRKPLTIIMVLGLLVSIVGFAAPASAENAQGKNLPTERLLVKFKPGATGNEIALVHKRVGGTVDSVIPGIGVHVVTVPRGQGSSKSAAYRMHKEVGYVELDGVLQVVDVPDDLYFDKQWGMAKVQALEAWDIIHGSPDIVIAILDTGIDMDHPDLVGKIVSDANFTESPTSNYNGHDHATHVAGIAAAVTNNSIGVAGLGNNCSLMNVKVLGDDGFGYESWVAQGIIWAADNGADVINLSLGDTDATSVLEDAVDYAWSQGVVVVAAAGNVGNSDPFYPAYYSNCLAVGATTSEDDLPAYSNRGAWVDVAAPGSLIYSTLPSSQYGYKWGTSMASPHVAGLAGLVFSVATDSNGNGRVNDEVRSIIESSCDDVGIDVAFGRINAYRAVQGFSPLPIGQIAGTVTDADSGEAIGGATVSDGTRSDTTDASGYYSIADVPEGSYTVTALADGYESASGDAAVTAGETAAIDFGMTHINRAPILDPIGDRVVAEGQLLQFVVSASDPDGDSLTFTASDLPAGASFNPTTQTFAWTPDYDRAGSYAGLGFEVSDGVLSDTEEITITVNDVMLTGQIAGTVTDAASGEAIGGATVSDGTRSATTDASGYYSIADVPEGSYTVTALADGYESASGSVAVTAGETTVTDFGLTHINRAPTLEPIGDRVVAEGQLLQFVVSASDPDGDTLTYSASDLPAGASFNPAAQTFTWTPDYDQAGSYAGIGFEVSDGVLSDAEEITITVNDVVLTGQIAGTVTDAGSGDAIGGATVSDGTRSATTDLSGYYSITDVPEGSYTVTASADGYESASRSAAVTGEETTAIDFALTHINRAPTLDPIGHKVVEEGQLLQFVVSASDPDGDTLTYSASDLPVGASFNPATQIFIWTPDYDQAGSYAGVRFEVSDGVLSDAEEITITVNDVVLTGQIAGTVTDAASGEAIAGAMVSDGIRSATTDPSGYYSITDVPEGSYTVTALADGYESASSSIVINPYIASTSTVDFSLEKEIPTQNTIWVESITFTPSGKHLTITVKVVNPDPVKKAQVDLELVKDGTLASTFSGLTNKAGEVTFRLRHAANGEYLARIIQLTYPQYVWDDGMGAISAYSQAAR